MKAYSTLIICIIALTSCGQSQNNKIDYTNDPGKFTIQFPANPIINQEARKTEFGELETYSFIANLKSDDNISYEVRYYDIPQSYTDTLSVASTYDLFDAALVTDLGSSQFEVLNIFNHKISGYTGREFRLDNTTANRLSRKRLYLVDNRIYLLTVTTEKENNFNYSIGHFFESFELIETKSKLDPKFVKSKDESFFNISFPKKTEIREMEVSTEFGNAKTLLEGYQPKNEKDENLIYLASSMKYPFDITKTDSFNLNNYYTNIIQGALAGRQSSLIERKEITKNGILGVEVKESFRNGEVLIKQWTFLNGDTQISVQVMTIPENYNNISMNNFFESFQILDR